MAWSKKQIVEKAFAKIGLATYNFDLMPEQLQAALEDLDAMVAGWNANGVRIGYPLPSSAGGSSLAEDTGVPDFAIVALWSNLALLLAPEYGKTVPQTLSLLADSAYNNVANQTAYPTMERQMPNTMPRGQGTKPWRNFTNPFVREMPEAIDAGSDGPIILE